MLRHTSGGIPLLVVAVLFFSSELSRADTFVLNDGRRIQGTILKKSQDSYRVHSPRGIVTISRDSITDHQRTTTTFDRYLKRAARTDRSHKRKQYELALWCQKAKLTEQARQHYQQVLRLDPDHEKARAALGYEKVDDRWTKKGTARKPVETETPATDPAPVPPAREHPTVLLKLKTEGKRDPGKEQYAAGKLNEFLKKLEHPMVLRTAMSRTMGSPDYVLKLDLQVRVGKTTRFYGQTAVSTTYHGNARLALVLGGEQKKTVLTLPARNLELNLGPSLTLEHAFAIVRQKMTDEIISHLSRHEFFRKRGAKPIESSS